MLTRKMDEISFIDEIDARFDHLSPAKQIKAIQIGCALSYNAATCIIYEIVTAAHADFMSKNIALRLLFLIKVKRPSEVVLQSVNIVEEFINSSMAPVSKEDLDKLLLLFKKNPSCYGVKCLLSVFNDESIL